MSDRWLTIEQAAIRVHRERSTIRGWISNGHLREFNHLVRADHLLEVDRKMRANRGGRPSKRDRVPLVLDGREVGHLMISPDGRISGRIDTPKPTETPRADGVT